MADKSRDYLDKSDPLVMYVYDKSSGSWQKLSHGTIATVKESALDALISSGAVYHPGSGTSTASTSGASGSTATASATPVPQKCGLKCKIKKAGGAVKDKATTAGKKAKDFGHKVKTTNEQAREKLDKATSKAKSKSKKVFVLDRDDPRYHQVYEFGEVEEDEYVEKRPAKSKKPAPSRQPRYADEDDYYDEYEERPVRKQPVRKQPSRPSKQTPKRSQEPRASAKKYTDYTIADTHGHKSSAQTEKSARAIAYHGAKTSKGRTPDSRTFVVYGKDGRAIGAVTKLDDGKMAYCKFASPRNLYYSLKSDGTLGSRLSPNSY